MDRKSNKLLLGFAYAFLCSLFFAVLAFILSTNFVQDFFIKIEQNTFDVRQKITSRFKKANKDIVILSVNDISYEYIMDKSGSWPISRSEWAKIIDAIENVNPKIIAFDMLFLKKNLNDEAGDDELVKRAKKYNNIYFAMSFDNFPYEERSISPLPLNYQLKLNSGRLNDNQYITFYNKRSLFEELEQNAKNVGAVNISRDNDGIIRQIAPIFKYQENYYPSLVLKLAMDLLNVDKIELENNKIILDKNHFIPLNDTSRTIINWFGLNKTYNYIPYYKVAKALEENDSAFISNTFRNKIVLIGTTSPSLGDVKSVPLSNSMAGVGLQANFLNNILDNNFIKRISFNVDFFLTFTLSLILGYLLFSSKTLSKGIFTFVGFFALYNLLAIFLMLFLNLWISVVFPSGSFIFVFISIYCVKYILKTKDYEQTYKLAITDGLTSLYNHRHFQEQMIANLNNYKRYGVIFSLIIIDIDFFKKINDEYGHQTGDFILKQVASILKANSRSTDIVCRYGGEEMTVILPNTNKSDAVKTAFKIWSAIKEVNFVYEKETIKATVSIGVSSVETDGETVQELIEYSDKCLYKAKETGRDKVIFEI